MKMESPSIQQKSIEDSSGINEHLKVGYSPLVQEPDN